MGLKLKKISHGNEASVYALAIEPSKEEYAEFSLWLDRHCPGDYDLDKYHLFIGHKSEVLMALKWAS